MKILVTGTAGFIGFHVVNRLMEEGHEVVGLDSINNYYDVSLKIARLEEAGIPRGQIAYREIVRSEKHPDYRFVQLKLEDMANLEGLFREEEFTHVINLAAQAGVRYSLKNPSAYVQSNIVGFANLLECCRRFPVRHLVYASSSSVYGNSQQVPFKTTDNVDHPVSFYAATKKTNELLAHSYSHVFGLPTTGLRFFTVYGPWGRPDMAYFLFTDAILKGRTIDVFNHGKMSRDFTYVSDVVEGVVKTLPAPPNAGADESSSAPYRIYNIGNNAPVSLLDFVEEIERQLDKPAEKRFLPLQPGDVETTYADSSALMRDMGYKPDTKLAEGIKRFVNWYQEYYRA